MNAKTRKRPKVGSTWRSKLGGPPVVVVGYDDDLALVKDARESKKNLARVAGGRLVSVRELREEWTELLS